MLLPLYQLDLKMPRNFSNLRQGTTAYRLRSVPASKHPEKPSSRRQRGTRHLSAFYFRITLLWTHHRRGFDGLMGGGDCPADEEIDELVKESRLVEYSLKINDLL
jgi:hypothetical protein